MNVITKLIWEFGLPVIVGATVLYLVLRGEIQFRHPYQHAKTTTIS